MKLHRKKNAETKLSDKIVNTLTTYLKTQFLVVVAVSTIAFIILTVLGVQHALFFAGITGSLSIVPFFGMIIAAFVTGIGAIVDNTRFLNGWHPLYEGVAILIIYIILNQLIDFVLAPYITGKYTHIKPVFIFLSVLVGTLLFGIVGAIFAVPVFLVVRTLLEYYSQRQQK